jgi:putative CocE/NonD family hydrolase
MTRFVLSLALTSLLAPATAAAGASPAVDLTWGVKIPLRDGVPLNATIYRPHAMEAPQPVIFTLTPYIGDTYHARAMWFARNGYVFALVDARGRGSSEGKFEPLLQEAHDGSDVVEWLAKQSWCNGKVAMWGGSYAGYDQWATAKEAPPHLQTIVPAAAAYPGLDFPMWKNISYPYLMQWLTYTGGVTPNTNLFGEASFWISKFSERYLTHRPFRELDQIVGNPSATFQSWIAHPMQDAYWDAMLPTDEQLAHVTIPVLTITGSYDDDQPGAMMFYRRHLQNASPEARDRHFLVIGPWDHAGTRTPAREVGGLTFGEASLVDLNQLHKDWYDWTLKGGTRPAFLKKRVAYYVIGAEMWKYADSLEAIGAQPRTYSLSSAGDASDVFHSGRLTDGAAPSPPDHYRYDPLDARFAELEAESIDDYITDQRYTLNLFGNGLLYHSEPFAEDTEVTGHAKLTTWIALDVPDTDFVVRIYEVMLDGACVLLATDQIRARYRESLRKETLVTPGQINRYQFDGFPFFSRRIAKGSRLRLFINSPNSIHTQKNYNGGGDVSSEGRAQAKTANVALYHDAEHPSVLEIPVVR